MNSERSLRAVNRGRKALRPYQDARGIKGYSGRGAPEGPRSKARGTEGRPEEGGEGLEDFYTIRYTDLAAPNFYLQAGKPLRPPSGDERPLSL